MIMQGNEKIKDNRVPKEYRFQELKWYSGWDSNPQPLVYKTTARTIELPEYKRQRIIGIEPILFDEGYSSSVLPMNSILYQLRMIGLEPIFQRNEWPCILVPIELHPS